MKTLITVLLLTASAIGSAQSWSGILSPSEGIDWSTAGVGGIPARATNCTSLTNSATVSTINAALASCPSGQTVALAAGTYTINGTINIPSNVTLRGAGADQTILNATGTSGYVVALGSNGATYSPTLISISGASAGATSFTVSSTSGMSVGSYLVVTEQNNGLAGVTNTGSEGTCTWCDGTSNGGLYSRGQIVKITNLAGSTVTVSPALYTAYTNSPVVYSVAMNAVSAGVENLQVYANNTGYTANFGMDSCAYCWIKGVESNYTDGDHVQLHWGYHDEVRDSYFSNAFNHSPGGTDSDVFIGYKTSASLVENNIIERTHVSIMLQAGPAGNVIAYNYMLAGYDSSATSVVIGGIDFHGANPQYTLMEGNVGMQIYLDSVWGSSTDNTEYRNWVQGSAALNYPLTSGSRATVTGGSTVTCGSIAANRTCYPFQASRAFQISYLSPRNNLVGNVVGSTAQSSNIAYGSGVTTYNSGSGQTDALQWPTTRVYDTTVYGYTFGYAEASDDGSWSGDSTAAFTSSLRHGNYGNISGAIVWSGSITHTLPASFYLAAKPSWWGSIPYPATGPDVSGGTGPGGHTYGNPAQACYTNVMHGTDGGAGGPYSFNASACSVPGTTASPFVGSKVSFGSKVLVQ